MKRKTVFCLSISISIAALILAGTAAAGAQDAKAFVGDWEGAVSIPEGEIDIICHFELGADGKLAGTIDSPSQGAYGLKLANITVEGKKISFGVDDPSVPGDPLLKGALDETGTKISGDFSQGGSQGTFEISKK